MAPCQAVNSFWSKPPCFRKPPGPQPEQIRVHQNRSSGEESVQRRTLYINVIIQTFRFKRKFETTHRCGCNARMSPERVAAAEPVHAAARIQSRSRAISDSKSSGGRQPRLPCPGKIHSNGRAARRAIDSVWRGHEYQQAFRNAVSRLCLLENAR